MKEFTLVFGLGICFFVVVPSFIVIETAIKEYYNTKIQTSILECKVQALKTGNSSQYIDRICSIQDTNAR